MKKRLRGISITVVMALLISVFPLHAIAAAPSKEDVDYLGKGKVEVEFHGDVQYKSPKVTVKDSSGKTYTASIYHKDDDEIKFKVDNYKTGKTYKFYISGVRQYGTVKYEKVSGSFKIPSAGSSISSSKAIDIALKDAGLSRSKVYDLDVEKERSSTGSYYEVSFETSYYEYEYHISLKGKILSKEKERD